MRWFCCGTLNAQDHALNCECKKHHSKEDRQAVHVDGFDASSRCSPNTGVVDMANHVIRDSRDSGHQAHVSQDSAPLHAIVVADQRQRHSHHGGQDGAHVDVQPEKRHGAPTWGVE